MKKFFNYKLTVVIALVMAFASCKNPGQDIKVVVNMDLMKYSALLHISDQTGTIPQNISLTMGGASGSDIYEISGKKTFPVKDGIITLGLSPSVTPTVAQDVNFTVTVTAPGYNTLTQQVTFKNGEMQQVLMVMLEKTATAAPATSDASSAPAATTTPATSTTPATTTTTTTPVTSTPATTTTTTPVTSTPATTTTTTPVTSTPATTTTTTPVTSTPATTTTTTPVTSKPATTTTTTPVTSTPAATTTTPVTTTPTTTTTVPVVAASPVNISLDFTGYCTNRTNLQIRPSLYVFYRLKDSGAAYAYLGYMKDGHMEAKLLFNKVYEFQITYGGVNYLVTGRIEQTSYQSTFDMGTAVCATF